MSSLVRRVFLALTASALAAQPVFATNGMNMEGYGAIATGMGGASSAYDNGTAAMMNNPATLGLMAEGHHADLAYGFLGPAVQSRYNGMSATSDTDSFSMPAFGWLRKSGALAYGVGIYGQGGMGTQYRGDTFMSGGSGLTTRSELGVGRVIFPLAYNVSPDLTVGGTLDVVWMGLDLQMAMTRSQIDAMPGMNLGSFGGSLAGALPGLVPNANDIAYFNFSNNTPYSGQARGYGFAGKLGMVYRVSDAMSVGASYHGKTRVSDMETRHAEIRAIDGGSGATTTIPGKITVHNFQWPETYGLGIAYRPNERWLLVADYKRVQWSQIMRDFRMTFSADSGGELDVTLNQFWRNQNVWMLGAAYQASKQWTLRGGVNLANNPVPNYYMHPLFPATTRNHATAGLGYAIDPSSGLDFSLSHAFKVQNTNAMGVSVGHSQTNWQMVYSHRY